MSQSYDDIDSTSPMSSEFFEQETIGFRSTRQKKDLFIKYFSAFCAIFASLFVIFITVFIITNTGRFLIDFKLFKEIITTEKWIPEAEYEEGYFGSKNLLISSLIVTSYAMILVIPIGISVGIFLAEICPKHIKNIIKPAIELINAIPSVVVGLLAIFYLTEFVRNFFGLNSGKVLITSSIALAFMTIPFIATLTDEALDSVPTDIKHSGTALGASKLEVIWKVSIPYAIKGIVSSCILAFARVIGETMVVAMVSAKTWYLRKSVFNPLQGGAPIPAKIAVEYKNVALFTAEYFALYVIALELLLLSFLVTGIGRSIAKKKIFLPSYRKIIKSEEISIKDLFNQKYGKVTVILWFFLLLATIWDIIETITYLSAHAALIGILILDILIFVSIGLFFFSHKIADNRNKLSIYLSTVPIILIFIEQIIYGSLSEINPAFSMFFLFIFGIGVFYSTPHAHNNIIEKRRMNEPLDAESITTKTNINNTKNMRSNQNSKEKHPKQHETDNSLKNNELYNTEEEKQFIQEYFLSNASTSSKHKHVRQAITFTLFRLITLGVLAIITAITIVLFIEGFKDFALRDLFSIRRSGNNYGWLPSILGSIIVVGAAALIALPICTFAGIYLFFYVKPTNKFGQFVKDSIQNIASVPSVVVGLFGWGMFVLIFKWGHGFLSGACTLAIMMIPIATSTSIQALEQVPEHYRLNALSLGATKWEAIKGQNLRYAIPSIITGYLMSISRVIGETAPIMLTVAVLKISSRAYPSRLRGEGIAMLPFTIWYLAIEDPGFNHPSKSWAMTGAMILLVMTMVLFIIGQIFRAKFKVKYE